MIVVLSFVQTNCIGETTKEKKKREWEWEKKNK